MPTTRGRAAAWKSVAIFTRTPRTIVAQRLRNSHGPFECVAQPGAPHGRAASTVQLARSVLGAPVGSTLGLRPEYAMRKHVALTRNSDIEDLRDRLRASAEETQLRLAELAGETLPLEFLYRLKFEAVGCDPLDSSRQLNLIEQLNQTFTYLASLNGAEFIFARHAKAQTLTLNLGTKGGWDIETADDGGIVAEVFAAVTPKNNAKLANDIQKVASASTKHRYVLFMSPANRAGRYKAQPAPAGVVVWSLGCDL